MHVTLHVLDSRPLAGHEDACRARVAPRYAVDVRHEGTRLEALGGGLLAREVLGVTDDAQLALNKDGKPRLVGRDAPAFNLSNDEGLVVLGVLDEDEGPIGVDVNQVPTTLSRASLLVAHKYYTPPQLAAVGDGSTQAQRVAFARAWGELEAPLKAMGTGFDFDLRHHREALDEWQLTCMDLTLPRQADGGTRTFVVVVAARERVELGLELHDALVDLSRLDEISSTPVPATGHALE